MELILINLTQKNNILYKSSTSNILYINVEKHFNIKKTIDRCALHVAFKENYPSSTNNITNIEGPCKHVWEHKLPPWCRIKAMKWSAWTNTTETNTPQEVQFTNL